MVSMRIQIWIQLFTSMRIQIQGAKPMRIHADTYPGQTLPSQKVESVHENTLYAGNRS